MKTTKTSNQPTQNQKVQTQDETVEVLYQRLGDRWFAFSMINDEVFVGSITPEEIQGEEAPAPQRVYKQSGRA